MSTYLIIGCGYLGRRVGGRLVEESHRVLGTTRTAERAESLAALGIEPIVLDVLDGRTLDRLPAADAALHCVGFDRTSGVDKRRVYVDGFRQVVERLASRVDMLVHTSSTSVYGQTDGGWVDEESPTDPKDESGRIVLEAEGVARAFEGHGKRAVILRLAGLYGPGRIVRREGLLRGDPIAGDPERWLNLVHVKDAASACVAALQDATARGVYVVADDRPVRRGEYYELAARLLGAPRPRFVQAEGQTLPVPEPNKRVSNRCFKSELGITLRYPDIATGLPAALAEENRTRL